MMSNNLSFLIGPLVVDSRDQSKSTLKGKLKNSSSTRNSGIPIERSCNGIETSKKPIKKLADRHDSMHIARAESLKPMKSISEEKNYALKGSTEFLEVRKSLPVYQYREEIIRTIRNNTAVVLVGETGSGKTTQVAQYLMESDIFQYDPTFVDSKHPSLLNNTPSIVITQPRRVAAVTVAKRVAQEMGTTLGGATGKVGYSVRFDECTGPNTRLKFATDGMLLREAILDPFLSKYNVILLDEAHERTLSTDILFGVVKKAMEKRNSYAVTSASEKAQKINPLRVVVMSATLNVDLFTSYFAPCASINVPGRTFPVEILYASESTDDYFIATVDTVLQICMEEADRPGDLLVFLPGQEEIENVSELLENRLSLFLTSSSASNTSNGTGTKRPRASEEENTLIPVIRPLYASLGQEAQLAAFQPAAQGTRKIILSTNVAETSVTISGIRFVVDSGKAKVKLLSTSSSSSGLESLVVEDISRASADQRAGRAGREGPGTCYRLYTEASYEAMLAETVPEIKRVSMSSVLLQLLAMGLSGLDALRFPFLERPLNSLLRDGLRFLRSVGAVASTQDLRIKRQLILDAKKQQIVEKKEIEESEEKEREKNTLLELPIPSQFLALLPSHKLLQEEALFHLTPLGWHMSSLPLPPATSLLLLAGIRRGCGAEASSVAALSALEGPVFALHYPSSKESRNDTGSAVTLESKQSELEAAKRRFASMDGDHLSLLAVFRAYERVIRSAAREALRTVTAEMKLQSQNRNLTLVETPKVVNFHDALESPPITAEASKDDKQLVRSILSHWLPSYNIKSFSASSSSKQEGKVHSKVSRESDIQSLMESLSSSFLVQQVANTIVDTYNGLFPKEKQMEKNAFEKKNKKNNSSLRHYLLSLHRCIQERVGQWGSEHSVSLRTMSTCVNVRDQLSLLCLYRGLSLDSCGQDLMPLRRALLEGLFFNLARSVDRADLPSFSVESNSKLSSDLGISTTSSRTVYKTSGALYAHIHPSSSLVLARTHVRTRLSTLKQRAQKLPGDLETQRLIAELEKFAEMPEFVVFGELIKTSFNYMRIVSRVEPEWIMERAKL